MNRNHNWADNLTYSSDAVHMPASVEEVQELVAAHRKVKALGTRHSFTDIADSPGGAQISLRGLEPDITIDADARTVSVTAGTTYGVLARHLHAAGWGLENLGSLPHISVGGATATATHGSGDTNRVLSASIAAVDLVTADGSLRRIDRTNPDLAALAVGLGAFGVIARLELDIQPTYQVSQHVYAAASWDQVFDAFDDVMASAYSVCVLGDIGGENIGLLWFKHRVNQGTAPDEAPESAYGGSWFDGSDLEDGHSLTAMGGVPGPWSERLAHFRPDGVPSAGGDELQTEYFVPRRHGVDALRAVRAMGDRISPHLHGCEIRTLAADDLWMSPAYERDSVCIGFTWGKEPEAVIPLLPDIEAALAPFELRPHFGKLFSMPNVADRFPRAGEFLDLAARYDPDRKFWNPFLERLT